MAHTSKEIPPYKVTGGDDTQLIVQNNSTQKEEEWDFLANGTCKDVYISPDKQWVIASQKDDASNDPTVEALDKPDRSERLAQDWVQLKGTKMMEGDYLLMPFIKGRNAELTNPNDVQHIKDFQIKHFNKHRRVMEDVDVKGNVKITNIVGEEQAIPVDFGRDFKGFSFPNSYARRRSYSLSSTEYIEDASALAPILEHNWRRTGPVGQAKAVVNHKIKDPAQEEILLLNAALFYIQRRHPEIECVDFLKDNVALQTQLATKLSHEPTTKISKDGEIISTLPTNMITATQDDDTKTALQIFAELHKKEEAFCFLRALDVEVNENNFENYKKAYGPLKALGITSSIAFSEQFEAYTTAYNLKDYQEAYNQLQALGMPPSIASSEQFEAYKNAYETMPKFVHTDDEKAIYCHLKVLKIEVNAENFKAYKNAYETMPKFVHTDDEKAIYCHLKSLFTAREAADIFDTPGRRLQQALDQSNHQDMTTIINKAIAYYKSAVRTGMGSTKPKQQAARERRITIGKALLKHCPTMSPTDRTDRKAIEAKIESMSTGGPSEITERKPLPGIQEQKATSNKGPDKTLGL